MQKTQNTAGAKRILTIVALAYLVFSIAMTLSRVWLGDVIAAGEWTGNIISQLSTYFIAMPLFLIVLSFLPDADFAVIKKKEPIKISTIFMIFMSFYVLTMIANIGYQFIVGSIVEALGVAPATPEPAEAAAAATSGMNIILMGAAGAMLAGFGEEFIARKMLYKKMAGCPDMFYILVAGILFGITHNSQFVQGIYASILGMGLAAIYLKTKSFVLVALLHTFVDFISLAVPPFVSTYLEGVLPETIAIMITIAVSFITLIYVLVRYNKNIFKVIGAAMKPATEPGWEYFERKPLLKMFANPAVAIFTIWCVGNMIYNLF